MSQSEHEASATREQDLVEKVAEMTATIADLTSTNTVLNSEVVDLRVCLQSADKELAEVKTGRRQDKKSHDEKLMECMQKVCLNHYTLGLLSGPLRPYATSVPHLD